MMRCLFVFRYGPVGGSRAQETFDLMLTLAAFDQKVESLLLDDGVLHLLPGQQIQDLAWCHVPALWQELELYGIEPPLVEHESLLERGLDRSSLLIPVRVVQRDTLPELFENFDRLMGD